MTAPANPFDLSGDVVLVTGADGGIGRAITQALRHAGATVVATDRRAADGIIAHDVTRAEDWARVAGGIASAHGRLSCLVNNAGIAITESIAATSLDTWRQVQSVNVESVLLGLHALVPLLREVAPARAGGASVVNLSSVGGLRGAAFNAAYCASKAAIAMFSKCAALEFAALGYAIRVNSVHPGGVETEMMDQILARYVDLGTAPSVAAAREGTYRRHPMGRMAQPAEIAAGVVYLCATASSFTTGTELVIDGGYISV